jgi:hypothetical protein
MKNKTLEPKTNTQPNLSPYQAERAEAQQTPVVRPDPLGATPAPPGSEAAIRAHAASLNRATAGPALRRLQRQYGNRYVQRVVELAQRRGSGKGFQLDDETAGRISRARGGGQPLDSAVQAHMSEALGHDFSGVRVHTDPEAHTLNRQLSARAFTTGQDIFFRQGEYNPGSGSGRELIAHELTHVVQQSTGRVSGDDRGMTVRPAGDAFEQEAEALGRRAARFSRAKNQRRVEASHTMAEPEHALAQHISERMWEEGVTRISDHRETGCNAITRAHHPKGGRDVTSRLVTGGAVQRALADNVSKDDLKKVNQGPMMCNQSVGYVLFKAGKITDKMNNEIFGITADAINWVANGTRMAHPYTNAPEDSVIGIRTRLSPKSAWMNTHVMLSVGGGYAYGTNNACVFDKASPLWTKYELQKHNRGGSKGEIEIYYRKP